MNATFSINRLTELTMFGILVKRVYFIHKKEACVFDCFIYLFSYFTCSTMSINLAGTFAMF